MNMHEPVRVIAEEPAPVDEGPVETLTSQALQLRPEFRALAKTLEGNRLTVSSNWLRWAPTVSAFGNLRAFNYGGFAGDNYAWAVGLQLDWILYDAGIRDANRKLAAAQRRENEAKLDLLRDQVRDDVFNANRQLATKRRALETARRCDAEFGLGLELIEANAEDVPLPSAEFDLVVSEYGASIWCDPDRWIAEAARLLRPGGELVFLRNSTLSMLCLPDTGKITTTLQRPQRNLHRLDWTDDDPGVGFHPGTGDMVRVLSKHGFLLLDLVELFAPLDALDHPHYTYVPASWAKQWPAEEIWRARKVSDVAAIGQPDTVGT